MAQYVTLTLAAHTAAAALKYTINLKATIEMSLN